MLWRCDSRETIVQTLQTVAASLGKTTLSKRDVQTHIALSTINYHFGNLGVALSTAGLSVAPRDSSALGMRSRLDDDVLFASLFEVEQKIGRPPNLSEYRANGGAYSSKPFSKRFGTWLRTLEHYNKWKVDHGTFVLENPAIAVKDTNNCHYVAEPMTLPPVSPGQSTRKPPQLFGEPIDFRGLRHAPINEQGVVYLFGMVSRELGFSVEALQQGFPD